MSLSEPNGTVLARSCSPSVASSSNEDPPAQKATNTLAAVITESVPTDWRELQTKVAGILGESGMDVSVERSVPVARGSVVVDVYAEREVDGLPLRMIVECKHWKSAVPKSVVHSFRTVVGDSGAHIGYIVGSGGFQSGSYAAADLTNISLVDWAEFQERFEKRWLEHHLRPLIGAAVDPLLTYTEPIVPRKFVEVDDAAVEKLRALRDRHMDFAWLMALFTEFGTYISSDPPELPIRGRAVKGIEKLPAAILDARGYREFGEVALPYAEVAIEEFREALRAGGVEP
jgi:restriction system protein